MFYNKKPNSNKPECIVRDDHHSASEYLRVVQRKQRNSSHNSSKNHQPCSRLHDHRLRTILEACSAT
jgi:hypothetical protein